MLTHHKEMDAVEEEQEICGSDTDLTTRSHTSSQ